MIYTELTVKAVKPAERRHDLGKTHMEGGDV